MSFSYYIVISNPGIEGAIQLGENKYIIKQELVDDESNLELKDKITAQAGSWKLKYKIVIDKYHFYVDESRSVELKPENVVVDGEEIIGFFFHEQFFDLSRANESVDPLYVPPDFLDYDYCYAIYAESVTLIPSGSFY